MKIFAFTLAEIIIVIGIIGVISAMTIPTLITNYQKKQTIARLSDTYAKITQAINLSTVENGDVGHWDFKNKKWFDIYLKNYIKHSEEKLNPISNAASIPIYKPSGARSTDFSLLKNTYGQSYRFTMLNGVDIIYNETLHPKVKGPDLIIDINGLNKRPNTFGKDVFFFYIDPENGFVPAGYTSTLEYTVPTDMHPTREFLKNPGGSYKYGCSKNQIGIFCAGLIMHDKWEIEKDYPW